MDNHIFSIFWSYFTHGLKFYLFLVGKLKYTFVLLGTLILKGSATHSLVIIGFPLLECLPCFPCPRAALGWQVIALSVGDPRAASLVHSRRGTYHVTLQCPGPQLYTDVHYDDANLSIRGL